MRASEALFRGLVEAAPDAIVGVEADGRIALVNAQAERLFGYRREELVGQPMEILVPEHVRAFHPEHRLAYFADPMPRPMGAGMQLAGRRKDGTEFPAEISLSTLETDDGVLVSAAVRDVTDRRRAEETQALLASIVQSSHDAIIGQTVDGIITSWNPGATRRNRSSSSTTRIFVRESVPALIEAPGAFAEFVPTPAPVDDISAADSRGNGGVTPVRRAASQRYGRQAKCLRRTEQRPLNQRSSARRARTAHRIASSLPPNRT